MEKTQFVQLLSQWETLESSGLGELQQLSEEHPWFQSLHMILLKRMHMEHHPSFNATLERLAIAVPDRTMLYNLIYEDKGLQKPLVASPPESISADKGLQTHLVVSPPEPEITVAEKSEEQEETKVDNLRNQDKEILIGKFIQDEPRIVPKEGDFAEAVNIAEKSNILYLDLVTETLADVYLKQGNKTKAIKIFEKLSLTIPEKSSYFAARIEELRKSSNRL